MWSVHPPKACPTPLIGRWHGSTPTCAGGPGPLISCRGLQESNWCEEQQTRHSFEQPKLRPARAEWLREGVEQEAKRLRAAKWPCAGQRIRKEAAEMRNAEKSLFGFRLIGGLSSSQAAV